MKIRAWKWRCESCGHEYTLPLTQLPPEQCTARRTWAICGGEQFWKVGDVLADSPASLDA